MEGMQKRILITLIIGLILIVAFYIITSTITKYTGFFVSSAEETPKSDFNNCLNEQDITLYVNTENIANTLKDIQVFNELNNVKIKNCLRANEECLGKGITSFPTWIINNKIINRDISLEELEEYSGCKPVIK